MKQKTRSIKTSSLTDRGKDKLTAIILDPAMNEMLQDNVLNNYIFHIDNKRIQICISSLMIMA